MNRYPLWKYLAVLALVVFGLIYSLPNIYVPDPAVQISPAKSNVKITQSVLDNAKKALDSANIPYIASNLDETSATIRFNNQQDQLTSRKIVQEAIGAQDYVVAYNLAANTPQWLTNIGAQPMSLGLDLAGGVHFLLEVDTDSVIDKELEGYEVSIKKLIRKDRLYDVKVSLDERDIKLIADTDESRTKIILAMRRDMPEIEVVRTERNGKFVATASMSQTLIREKERAAVKQNLVTLRNRVEELGVSEPVVQAQGRNRIVVQLPGIQDTARAKKILGKTANLEFRLAAGDSVLSSQKTFFDYRSEQQQALYGGAFLMKRPFVTGQNVTGASAGIDTESNTPNVSITLDSQGATQMHRETRERIGQGMGIVLIEYNTEVVEQRDENGKKVKKTIQVPDPKIVSLATIRSALGKQFQITGLDSATEAAELALYIRSGSLAAPMTFAEERTIGASLGQENIDLGVKSVQLGFLLVLIFMLFYYKLFGLFANIALAVNLTVLVAAMSLFGAVLTLPGIAGIVLTVGMAVDANVLIFSRVREEIKAGASPQSAISRGYDSAFSTILDANITTFIVAIILWAIGSGPVQGFAVTLAIGILTSMFTAIMGTRALVNLVYGGRKVKKLWV